MRRTPIQLVTAWLCLLAALVGGTGLTSRLVYCGDGHGGSRIEWGCERNDRGECVVACVAADDCGDEGGSEPHPCDDRRLADEVVTAKPSAAERLELPPMLPVSMFPLAAVDHTEPDLAAPCRVPAIARAHPPDAVAKLRSTIIIV